MLPERAVALAVATIYSSLKTCHVAMQLLNWPMKEGLPSEASLEHKTNYEHPMSGIPSSMAAAQGSFAPEREVYCHLMHAASCQLYNHLLTTSS